MLNWKGIHVVGWHTSEYSIIVVSLYNYIIINKMELVERYTFDWFHMFLKGCCLKEDNFIIIWAWAKFSLALTTLK